MLQCFTNSQVIVKKKANMRPLNSNNRNKQIFSAKHILLYIVII